MIDTFRFCGGEDGESEPVFPSIESAIATFIVVNGHQVGPSRTRQVLGFIGAQIVADDSQRKKDEGSNVCTIHALVTIGFCVDAVQILKFRSKLSAGQIRVTGLDRRDLSRRGACAQRKTGAKRQSNNSFHERPQ